MRQHNLQRIEFDYPSVVSDELQLNNDPLNAKKGENDINDDENGNKTPVKRREIFRHTKKVCKRRGSKPIHTS